MQESEETSSISCKNCRKEDTIEPKKIWTSSRALKNWIGGGFLFGALFLTYLFTDLNIVLFSMEGDDLLLSDAFYIATIAIAGNVILRNGYDALKKVDFNIDLLMSSAILGSIFASFLGGSNIFMEGATLAFLFNLAELLESYSVEKVKGSLRELMDISPDVARVRKDGDEVEMPVDSVDIGDTVIIRPGNKIPVDGVVVKGNSSVNEAPITGESIPVDKLEGDDVYAGTVNEQGYLEIETKKRSSESTISNIIEMVENAERKKTEHEKFIDKFSSYYTPIVVGAAFFLIVLPPLLFEQSWSVWFIRGLTMLVLACPCAFVISTPVSIVSSITSAAKNGVLIESGTSLEAMSEVDVVAFDKTGTLTKGDLVVTDIIPLNGKSEEDIISCACGIEKKSDHPIAEAIVSHVHENHGSKHDHMIEDFEEISGKGLKAYLGGKKHYAGKPSFMEELGFDLSHVHHSSSSEKIRQEAQQMCTTENCLNLTGDTIPRLQKEGKTVILVTNEDHLEGIIAVADEIRASSKKTIEKLRSEGIKTVMLTGDNENTAKVIADRIEIGSYRAELMPDEKVQYLKQLSEEYGPVAMVGDGINDAPALAAADVGIAMGAAGTDTALETADIALMQDDVSKLHFLFQLAKKAKYVIRENILASLGMKAILAIGVPFGLVSIALAVLMGDAGMTVGVTGNAMRISDVLPD